ncbi:hypothetical protein [Edwardsiella piscicida]|uniref:hypothetical protein n=1 Tax=Edwardsiella piscicida TaxID=1263550 RepID=UPI002478E4A2|nr:hypothetical protein [Edwardsiella piscicida]WGS75567.1 hypothetical protein PED68_09310 [Edwardsiella piscicida]WGS78956.1 hypothetical protein PED70_09315 [Edwardsiella piscicida]
MNELTITSRKTGEAFTFWMPSDGGYVRRTFPDRPGTLGVQICDGGKTMGNTISATPETFEKVCRRWYRAYQRIED